MKFILTITLFLGVVSCSSWEHEMSVDQKVEFKTIDNIKLNGFISSPQDKTKRYPAILLLEGSGKSPRKEEGKDDPFRLLAESLVEKGYVVMRYNKRGSGYNQDNGDFSNATISTHLEDGRSALSYLKNLSIVDANKIFLFGQSMGGTRATALAGENSDIRGVILFASPSFSPKGHTFIDFNNEQLSSMYKYAYKYDDKKIKEQISENTQFLRSVEDGTLKCSDFADSKIVKCTTKNGKIYLDGVTIDYYRETMLYDQLAKLSEVKCPILILQGTSDWVVPKSNALLAVKKLKESGNNNHQLRVINNLDHVFAENKTISDSVAYMMGVGQGKVAFKPLQHEFVSTLTSWLAKKSL